MKAWKVIGRCLLVLLCVVLVIAIVGIAQFFHRSDPKNVKRYDTDKPLHHRRNGNFGAPQRRGRLSGGDAGRIPRRVENRILRWIILNSTCI